MTLNKEIVKNVTIAVLATALIVIVTAGISFRAGMHYKANQSSQIKAQAQEMVASLKPASR